MWNIAGFLLAHCFPCLFSFLFTRLLCTIVPNCSMRNIPPRSASKAFIPSTYAKPSPGAAFQFICNVPCGTLLCCRLFPLWPKLCCRCSIELTIFACSMRVFAAACRNCSMWNIPAAIKRKAAPLPFYTRYIQKSTRRFAECFQTYLLRLLFAAFGWVFFLFFSAFLASTESASCKTFSTSSRSLSISGAAARGFSGWAASSSFFGA